METFAQFWPQEIKLEVFTDDALNRASWLVDFKAAHGKKPVPSYRFDAVRFAHKVAAMDIAYRELQHDDDVLIWVDADCLTHAPVSIDWLDALFPLECDLALLLRTYNYSETGFIMFRRNARTSHFMELLIALYTSGELFTLDHWHDSFAIDTARRTCERTIGLRIASLSGIGATTNHPLINGPLGERLDHLKGKRKARGKSAVTDLVVRRTEAYWRRNER